MTVSLSGIRGTADARDNGRQINRLRDVAVDQAASIAAVEAEVAAINQDAIIAAATEAAAALIPSSTDQLPEGSINLYRPSLAYLWAMT